MKAKSLLENFLILMHLSGLFELDYLLLFMQPTVLSLTSIKLVCYLLARFLERVTTVL